ncbi:hypothetical protein SFR_5138 [Streptomyces sp. FR-008]|nr:hypothetical protein SFR_5138 [Streptomyces sp. FR-008]
MAGGRGHAWSWFLRRRDVEAGGRRGAGRGQYAPHLGWAHAAWARPPGRHTTPGVRGPHRPMRGDRRPVWAVRGAAGSLARCVS